MEADKAPEDDVLDGEESELESQGRSPEPETLVADNATRQLEDVEEEPPVEEISVEEDTLDAADPGEALSQLEHVLEKDLKEDIPEVSRLSISDKWPEPRGRKKKRRIFDLARPKTNWQTLKDRPSVYWTERFLEDTTLSVTVPDVSHRVEELARPKRFYLEYYNNNRTTPIWPIPRSTLEYQASRRLKDLATPKIRNNIWSINMSEISQVSRAAQLAIPSPRILCLAKPRSPAPRLEEWDPVPKPKPHVSDYNRLLHLAMPKAQWDNCIPDRDPRWEVLDVTKRAVASPRTLSLAKPKERKDLNEDYDPYHPASPSSLPPRASPKKCDQPAAIFAYPTLACVLRAFHTQKSSQNKIS
ncbi:PREDICTED: testicular haploid expressed gene protein [Chrysochloris asiatica]|uniref:Testicular haploid expressed gene protein n=1 Tax=Chrysochloris asiatica TaxID=185453 RepID=A0A9B0U6D2_CHRAS|nr:PREDICTED: testicular haploid expressed gene protein [Chrysochloris asiatica]